MTNWRPSLEKIRIMRSAKDAPVDVIGCHMLHDKNEAKNIQRFQILLALMLSSQTKDEVTAAAMRRLQEKIKPLSPSNLLNYSAEEIGQLLNPVGFYRRKGEYVRRVAMICSKNGYDGDDDIPSTLEGLTALPGVGPKMALLTLQVAWDKVEGIAVDVHVNRISKRLGWTSQVKPERTRRDLEDLIDDRDVWKEVNSLLVGFGQTICLPRGPRCSQCIIDDCPSRNRAA